MSDDDCGFDDVELFYQFRRARAGDAQGEAAIVAMFEAAEDNRVRAEMVYYLQTLHLREFRKQASAEAMTAFARTDNPLIVWHTWAQSRARKELIPDWVENVFDEWAENLLKLAERPPAERVPEQAGKALGFGIKKNGKNPFRVFYDIKKSWVAAGLFWEKRAAGLRATPAAAAVANELNITPRMLKPLLEKRIGPITKARQPDPVSVDWEFLDSLVARLDAMKNAKHN